MELIPIVSDLMWDAKKQVKAAAIDCMEAICKCSGNKDLDPFVPVVIEGIQCPEKIPTAVEGLAGCVFVQEVRLQSKIGGGGGAGDSSSRNKEYSQ